MRAAFLVVASRAGSHEPDAATPADVAPSALGFVPAQHLAWAGTRGRVSLEAWHDGPLVDEPPWVGGEDRVVAVAGDPLWPNGPWRSRHDIAARLLSDPAAVADLRGFFAATLLGNDGHGSIENDPLGMRCLYWGETRDHFIAATRAGLVAAAMAAAGEPPARDVSMSAWLAFTSYPIGDGTGYEGVHLLTPGSRIVLAPGADPVIQTSWACQPDEATLGLGADELVELAATDLTEGLRAVLRIPAGRRVIRLTGGKDSRLLLAVALSAGVADEFEYETIGSPDLADVVVAEELAQRFGLRHQTRFVGMGSAAPYGERIPAFVDVSAGMVNLWDAEPATDLGDDLTLIGICAEILRSPRPIRARITTVDDLAGLFPPEHYARLGLVVPAVADELHRTLLRHVLSAVSPRMEPRDQIDAFYIANRMRLLRAGPRLELIRDHRVAPLYSIGAARAAYAMSAAARHAEEPHFEIIRRASPALAGHRLVGPGWRRQQLDRLPPELRPAAAPSAAGKPPSVMQQVQRGGVDERTDLYRSVLSERDNRAWDVLDRSRALAELDRFGELAPRDRRELTGAVTAALWCGRAPLTPDR